MDKSKIHIAMADCPEIQRQREPASTDFESFDYVHIKKGFIWLPRQDQYWDMVADSLGCIHERGYWCQDCHEVIGKFMREDHPSIINLLMSKADVMTREVVLLVFYMKEAHGKIWDVADMKWTKLTDSHNPKFCSCGSGLPVSSHYFCGKFVANDCPKCFKANEEIVQKMERDLLKIDLEVKEESK